MRSFGFLLSRRWLVFAVVVASLAYLAWWLGEWQFGRLEDRRERNAVVERNESADPVPVTDVLATGRAVDADDEWRLVSATGEYAAAERVIVRYRTRDGEAGVDVVVPLVLPDGTAVLVDRGWMATANSGTSDVDVPEPPAGEVTITGWVRADATGSSTRVSDASTRAVSSREIGPALEREVLGGFLDLRDESPPPAEPLERAELPDLGDGPHFFYGLQWWFFGVLAVAGFGYLAYDERRGPRRRRRDGDDISDATEAPDGSESPEQTTVDRDHRAGDVRRGR